MDQLKLMNQKTLADRVMTEPLGSDKMVKETVKKNSEQLS